MTKRFPTLPLLGAIGLPVFILGSGLLSGYVNGGTIGGDFWAQAPAYLIAFVALAVGCVGVFLHYDTAERAVLTVLFGLALMASFTGAAEGIDDWVLIGSGETATCTVTGISDRTVSQADTVVILHDHRLACDGPGPEMVTSTETLAEPGEPTEVVYDPDGHYETRAMTDLGAWEVFLWLAIGGFALAVVLGFAEFFVEARR